MDLVDTDDEEDERRQAHHAARAHGVDRRWRNPGRVYDYQHGRASRASKLTFQVFAMEMTHQRTRTVLSRLVT